jgi:hypothetical protein
MTNLAYAAAALNAYHENRSQVPASERASNLVAKVLGMFTEDAVLANDAPDGEIWYDVGDMQLRFILGATEDDDYFIVIFMNVPVPNGFRTQAGLGLAIETALEQIRITGEYIAQGMEP